MIEEIKLVNRSNINGLFNGSADIDFDILGNLERIEGDDALYQSISKAIETTTQEDGYGTLIYNLIGKKNTQYIKSRTLIEVLSTLNVLKKYQNSFYLSYPSFNIKAILEKIYSVLVNTYNKVQIDVIMKLNNKYNIKYNERSLPEVKLEIK